MTGGSRGIGREVVKALAGNGINVAFTYLSSEDDAQALQKDIQSMGVSCHAFQADSRDAQSLQNAVKLAIEQLGSLDIVVNNAGNFFVAPLEEMTIEQFDQCLALNLRAGFVVAKTAVPLMNDGGRVIFIGSNVAFQAKFDGLAAYSAAKAGVSGLVHALARELGTRSITVNAIHPGSTDTDMNPASGEIADWQRANMARPSFVQPSEIGELVAFLASDGAKSITGADIVVDNGANA